MRSRHSRSRCRSSASSGTKRPPHGAQQHWKRVLREGQYEDPLTYFERALAIREKKDNPSDLSQTLHNIGETHVRMGQFDHALEQYLRALELSRKAGETRTERSKPTLSERYSNIKGGMEPR